MNNRDIKKIFITGGSGFVGQALVRELLNSEFTLALLSRDSQRLPEQLRSLEIIKGDLEVASSFQDSLKGCDIVIHCAKSDYTENGNNRDIAGTRNLLNASIDAGVRRFIYLSSISVYGITPPGTIDENSPRQDTGDAYTKSKILLESEVMSRKDRIEVVILQPANVYGPGPCWWGSTMLNLMRRGRVILVDEGEGVANLVHVFDLVQAIRLAITADGTGGECFLITDGRPIKWREYFQGLESIVGQPATMILSIDEAKKISHKLLDRSLLMRSWRWLERNLFGQPIIYPLDNIAIDKYACRTIFSIEKAVRDLNFQPKIDFKTGLKSLI